MTVHIDQYLIKDRLKWKHIPFNEVEIAKGRNATYTIFNQTNVMEVEYKNKRYIGHKCVRIRARFIWLVKAIANMIEMENVEIERGKRV